MLKNLVYFGSAQFTANILESLIEANIVNVVAVVTTPDMPIGRKQIITPSPLAQLAEKYNLPTYKPEKLDEPNLAHLKLLKPDIFLVVAYGQYFTKTWLEAPSVATLNIHFSLLPKYRGSLCVSEPIKNGDKETGVTLMEMGEKLDGGPIISQKIVNIEINDNVATLTEKLANSAKSLLTSDLPKYMIGEISSKPQNEDGVTYTPFVKTRSKQNAFVDFKIVSMALNGEESLKLHNLICSQNPDPGTWTIVDGKELKLLKTSIQNNRLVIETIQVAGKTPIPWKQFQH